MNRELITDIKDFVESYFAVRECEEYCCSHSRECFNVRNRWGLLAFDDPLSNAAGGKPFCHCFLYQC